MKIYTKTGDKGTTSLISGKRISKSDLRLNTYGTIDELNSFTGYLNSMEIAPHSREVLTKIQNLLFTIGSNLALEEKSEKFKIPEVKAEHTTFLENEIDYMEKGLEPLQHFIIPGGDQRVGLAHVCRTVCRRAERLYVELSLQEKVEPEIGNFLNRLADFYFMMARRFMKDFKVEPIIWDPKT
ncbi:MAG: cob(I)yrinic acid a,c-diamide adenosyltransferase [Spirochaetaceae bacterium]|nr:cob(I)yrinic acid a,c-diamide adenosyltransferase [Spirochaetaceae bacterium]